MTKPQKLHFDIFRDSKGDYRWHIKHQNGNIVCQCTQGYSRRYDALTGFQRMWARPVIYPDNIKALQPVVARAEETKAREKKKKKRKR